MSYTLFLQSLESARDADGQTGCYRQDAVQALAQEDISAMLDKSASPNRNRVAQLNEMLREGVKPDFSTSDAHCDSRYFDASYAQAVERCNLFLIQKQLMSLNTQATRVDIAARLADINPQDMHSAVLDQAGHPSLAREIEEFKKLSTTIAGLLAFDISRQKYSEPLQKSIHLIGGSARNLLATLSSARLDATQEHKNASNGSAGIRNGN